MRLLALLLVAAAFAPSAQASAEVCVPTEDPTVVACALAGGESSGSCDDEGFESNALVLRLAAGDVSARASATHACDAEGQSETLAAGGEADAPVVEHRHAFVSWSAFKEECRTARDVDGWDSTHRCPFGQRPPRPPLVLP